MPRRVVISPKDMPPMAGESWWIVHPNNGNVIFSAPVGAVTVCIYDYRAFCKDVAYTITDNDELNARISIKCEQHDEVVEMPYYLFARYFDAEAFVRPACSERLVVDLTRFEG